MGAKETLGDVIRKAREERGISQRELASKVNVSYSTISRIEQYAACNCGGSEH